MIKTMKPLIFIVIFCGALLTTVNSAPVTDSSKNVDSVKISVYQKSAIQPTKAVRQVRQTNWSKIKDIFL